ncbi:hypothetical protein SAMN02745154_00413 [Mycoplasmopsis verecunda]|uniref:Uncharacterized protein n=1 Tax=Mycoplasmopsis verecunda TaxID=171291 RepID=A0A1T4LDN1_9BACT|nr:hypothetical protein SAMN02745154_00413 [Mycoplasmopsis verecunda]
MIKMNKYFIRQIVELGIQMKSIFEIVGLIQEKIFENINKALENEVEAFIEEQKSEN